MVPERRIVLEGESQLLYRDLEQSSERVEIDIKD